MKLSNPLHKHQGYAALGLLLLILGGVVLFLSLPGALMGVQYLHLMVASGAIVVGAFGWILYSAGRQQKTGGDTPKGTLASWEAPAALAAILLTGLWGFWTMKTGQMDQWEDKDEVERAKAPSWNHSFDTLQGGMRWEDIRDRLSKEGYKMRCYALGPNEGMEPGDTHACWTVANQTWGIPTHTLSFLFGPEGLRQVRFDYGKEQWPAVKSWFDQLPGVSTGTFGRDQGGNIIIGKMIASGQVLTAEPKHLPNMMVLWQARSRLQATLCKGTEHDPKWNLICKPSNP